MQPDGTDCKCPVQERKDQLYWPLEKSFYQRNPDNRERGLERRALSGDPAAQDRYYASLYRRGALAGLVDEQLAAGEIDSAALWYWKERFQEGHDVIFPVTNDSPVSEGYPHHGDTYNVILQHPNQKPPADRFHRSSTPVGQKIGDLSEWWLKPTVMFYDPKYQEDPNHPGFRARYAGLGSRTPGSYYADTLLEDRPGALGWLSRDPARPSKAERVRQEAIGLNFQGGSPEWSIDGPAYAQVLEVLKHVLDSWEPPELPQRHQKILKRLHKEQEEERVAREDYARGPGAPKRRLAAKKRIAKRKKRIATFRKKTRKKVRRCGKCRKVGHDRRTCPKRR